MNRNDIKKSVIWLLLKSFTPNILLLWYVVALEQNQNIINVLYILMAHWYSGINCNKDKQICPDITRTKAHHMNIWNEERIIKS